MLQAITQTAYSRFGMPVTASAEYSVMVGGERFFTAWNRRQAELVAATLYNAIAHRVVFTSGENDVLITIEEHKQYRLPFVSGNDYDQQGCVSVKGPRSFGFEAELDK